MERLLAKLERQVGHLAPAGVITWLVALQGTVYVLLLMRPELWDSFGLSRGAVLSGEWWRLFTYFFMPWGVSGGTLGPIFTLMSLLFLLFAGRSLEGQWGPFKFDLYLLIAGTLTTLTGLLVGGASSRFIYQCLILSFAAEFPELEIYYFFFPLKMKWLGLFDAVLLGLALWNGGLAALVLIAPALFTFFLFSGPSLLAMARGGVRVQGRARELGRFRQESAQPVRSRVCARCGKSEKDDPALEFRICSCEEKCGGRATEYCLAHARNH
jgi:hypothetical protein